MCCAGGGGGANPRRGWGLGVKQTITEVEEENGLRERGGAVCVLGFVGGSLEPSPRRPLLPPACLVQFDLGRMGLALGRLTQALETHHASAIHPPPHRTGPPRPRRPCLRVSVGRFTTAHETHSSSRCGAVCLYVPCCACGPLSQTSPAHTQLEIDTHTRTPSTKSKPQMQAVH